jgi:hypothetical protein
MIMISRMWFVIVLIIVYAQDDYITIEEGTEFDIDEENINMDILYILTGISSTDQPTRIQNSDGEKTYYILEYQDSEYFLTVKTSTSETVEITGNFLEIN